MVLQGDEEGLAPPFDASLYGASFTPSTPASEYEMEYAGCDAIVAFFQTTSAVREILPEGIEPFADPPQAGAIITRYPFSTVGQYNEFLSLVQVEDLDGEMAYYIPYIYVTNDAAMAAGRETAGAPKKIADIELERTGDAVAGRLERPVGDRLYTVWVKAEQRALGGMVDAVMPDPTPLLSLRHLPAVEGGDGRTDLVKWYADMRFHTDDDGDRKMWTGPCDVRYDTKSSIDPVHRVPAEEVLLGGYAEFDMALGLTEIQKTWEH